MTFDDTFKIVVPIVVILSPLFKMFFTISSRLDKIEKQLELDKERIEESWNGTTVTFTRFETP